LPRLFQLFGKLNDPDQLNQQGSGMGLLICKKIVERMGGEIDVISYPGEGSTFTFSIPVE